MTSCYSVLFLFLCYSWEVITHDIYECESSSAELCILRGVTIASPEDFSSIELPEEQQFLQLVDGNIPEFDRVIYGQLESTVNLTVTNSGVTKLFVGPLLVHLNASWNKITQIERDSGEDYSGLRVLVLSHNEFNRIPNIKDFSGLEVLDLSYNKLDVVSLGLFNRLKQLRRLDLSSNKMLSLDAEQGFRLNKLTELNLANNRLLELDFTGWSLPSLTYLELAFNLLSYLNGADIKESFPKLLYFGLSTNQWNCRALTQLREALMKSSITFIGDMYPCAVNYSSVAGNCCYDNYLNYVTLQSQWDIRKLRHDMRTMNETLIVKLAAVRDEQGARIGQLEQQLKIQEQQIKRAKEHLQSMAGLIEDLIEELYLRELEGESDEVQRSRKGPMVKIAY